MWPLLPLQRKMKLRFVKCLQMFFIFKIFKRSSKALLVRIHSLDITYVIIFPKYNFVTDLLAGLICFKSRCFRVIFDFKHYIHIQCLGISEENPDEDASSYSRSMKNRTFIWMVRLTHWKQGYSIYGSWSIVCTAFLIHRIIITLNMPQVTWLR